MKKTITIMTLLLALSLTASAQSKKKTSGNPILDGWYADPEAIVYGDQYWVFPTYSVAYDDQLHFDAFSSYDLVTWTKHPYVLQAADFWWAHRAVWAPAVISANGKYYLFFGANDMHEGEIGGIGVGVSDKPEGPYKDVLHRPLISHVINGAQPIDQYIFHDDDGQYYMYYGGWGHCNVVRLSQDLLKIIPFDDGVTYKEITPENYVEGPFMLKRNGKYYFMWSEGSWGGPDYCVAYAISDSPLGPFKRIGKILQQDPEVATSAGHHSVMKGKGDDEYYILYHRRPLGDNHRDHRVTCIEYLTFDKDGMINPVKISFDGVKASRLK